MIIIKVKPIALMLHCLCSAKLSLLRFLFRSTPRLLRPSRLAAQASNFPSFSGASVKQYFHALACVAATEGILHLFLLIAFSLVYYSLLTDPFDSNSSLELVLQSLLRPPVWYSVNLPTPPRPRPQPRPRIDRFHTRGGLRSTAKGPTTLPWAALPPVSHDLALHRLPLMKTNSTTLRRPTTTTTLPLPLPPPLPLPII